MEGAYVNKVEINVYKDGQVNIAEGNAVVDAVQNNGKGGDANTKNNIKMFQNNKKEEYIKNWNSRLFLHQDNDERPITLVDAFIMPDYIKHKCIRKMELFNADTLDKIIDKFVKYDRTLNMLIAGVPGIGKSTITSWIANQYKDDDRVIVLRFRDWESEELEEGLLKAIYNTLQCKKTI